ncbi:MAG: hypothetical protein H7Y30_07720, partial [Pyrinomonadaceae bacterium]|nr:hypothetical protein [Pyrinomonadaceae bacterium]
VMQMIDAADSVIVFLTNRATSQVKKELTYAISLNKPVIPIVEKGTSTKLIGTLLQSSKTKVFYLDPASPWKMENELKVFLQKEQFDKDTRNAIFALAGTFVGLLLLQKLSES